MNGDDMLSQNTLIIYLRRLVEERRKKKVVLTREAVTPVAPVLQNERMENDR
jgi:hypothetical protein